jgi:hypothetical protein
MEYQDAIAQVNRILKPRGGRQIKLGANYTAGSGTMTVDTTSPYYASIQPGALISNGLNVVFVYGVPSAGVVSVVGGFQGSTDANATSGAVYEINPRWTEWDISVAINQELLGLASPNRGLGQVLYIDQTYIPVYMGYDLGASFQGQQSRVLEISYRIAPPYKNNPLIRRGEYRVLRNQNDAGDFPSGNGVVIYKSGWPGFPIHVQFLAPFTQLVNLTDDLTSVAGVPLSAQDIVVYGAALRLAPDREIARNSLNNQPDPRKATEVPAGAMLNSVNAMEKRYMQRIADEASYLKRAYPQAEYA